MFRHLLVVLSSICLEVLAIQSPEAGVILQSCENVNGKNLTILSGNWDAVNGNTSYMINFCSGIDDSHDNCGQGSSVCMKQQKAGETQYVSLGNFSSGQIVSGASSISFYLEYKTGKKCGNGEVNYSSTITFDCGKTLGSPSVLYSDECRSDFLWESYVVCNKDAYDPISSVKCYGHDVNGKKHDLDGIIKRGGAYKVTNPSNNGEDIYFNVCRDILIPSSETDDALHNCPAGSAVCLVKGDHTYSLGVPRNGVQMNGTDKLLLTYHGDPAMEKPPTCNDFIPSVTVTFICPGTNRGASRKPLLTSSVNCHYDIVWWTEVACPEDFVKSSSCQLDARQHGVAIDLAALTKSGGAYKVSESDDADSTYYWLNICAATGQSCGVKYVTGEKNAVCQVNPSGEKKVAGLYQNQTLQYIDEELTLLYKNGERCSQGLRRNSLIMFHCNKTAGTGAPKFSHESHCTYYFEWQTNLVCVEKPASCEFTDSSGLEYDMSSLTRVSGSAHSNWQVLTGGSDSNKHYYLNMCGELLHTDEVSSSDFIPGSAVAFMVGEKFSSYGSYYNSTVTKKGGEILVTYGDGDSCSDGKKKQMTYISLHCSPGDLESSPVLKYEPSGDKCALELKWHTAAACPLTSVRGQHCMISDKTSGLVFDLSRLTRAKKEDMYQISTASHDFYINICDSVVGSPCTDNSGVCQVEKGNSRHWSLGQASDDLLYYRGFVKLTYSNGDKYSDNVHRRSVQFSFLCDPEAGNGRPVFAEESNHTYVFNWYTSYVCPSSPVQCMVTDDSGKQYDLSSLAKSEDDSDPNWSALDPSTENSEQRLKYYINVCRPVNEVWGHDHDDTHDGTGCDRSAGACQTAVSGAGDEHVSVKNLGVPFKPPEIEGEGRLVLTYVNGSKCDDSSLYTTKIHFVCSKGQLTSSPSFLEKVGCVLSFIWHTDAACPIQQGETEKNCEAVDPNSNYVFDLRPLRRPESQPYLFSGEDGYQYEINVCGGVSSCADGSGKYGGCRINTGDSSIDRRVSNNSTPLYSDDGVLTLYYSGQSDDSGRSTKYIISFICNHTFTKNPTPSFSRVDGNEVHVDFNTHLACKPEAVDCLVTDDFGNQYDLTALSNGRGYFTAETSDSKRQFYVSVCKPLPSIPSCPVGGVGACMVSSGNGTSLGLVQSNPTAVSSGDQDSDSSLSITYNAGDFCVADKSRRYSTRILFFCSNEVGTVPVYYANNTDPCEFAFTWRTPAACKAQRAIGHDCAVTEPLYGMRFDLSRAMSDTDYTVHTGGEWDYSINVCQKLQSATGKCAESAACQVQAKGASPAMHDAGKPNSTLVYEDGVITLKYWHGQKCHNDKFERSTVIRFTCNHGDSAKDIVAVYKYEQDDCTYLFDWQTPHACPPIKIVGCTATDQVKNLNYDLSSLSLPDQNHVAGVVGASNGRSYYLNVCRNLLLTPGTTCPPNSAACVKTKDGKYKNLGRITSDPRLNADGNVQILYTEGDVCKGTKRYSTTITFKCAEEGSVNSVPLVTIPEDNCHVEVVWRTKAACPVNTAADTQESCVAENPVTGHKFNLSSLTSPTYYEVQDKERNFQINVCGPVRNGACGDNTGVCVTKDGSHISAGKATSTLTYANGALEMTYPDGDTCEANSKYSHTTVLSFVCHRSTAPNLSRPNGDPEGGSRPVYISEDAETCTHYFSWHVFEACEYQSPCAVVDSTSLTPRVIDLSGLISESGHTVAVSDVGGDDSVYFINICRSLEPNPGYLCPAGSAACRARQGSKPKGIGFMTHDIVPKLDPATGSVSITYPTGTPCDKAGHADSNVTSKVVISCFRGAGKGQPHLTAITDDCTYLFEWATGVICKGDDSHAIDESDCSFRDSGGVEYNLSKLEPLSLKYQSQTVDISVCKTLSESAGACENSYVCSKKGGKAVALGKNRRLIDGPSDVAFVAIFTGGTCNEGSGGVNTTVLFTCSRTAAESNGASLIHDSVNPCKYVVYWPTPYACPPLKKECTVTDPDTDKVYDLSLLSSISHAHKFKGADETRYLINICQPVHTSTTHEGCKEDAAVCRIESGKKVANTIGILQSQKMSVLKTSDGPAIEVRYSGGDAGLCIKNRFASTVIRFTCGKSIHTDPTFDRFDEDKCVYYFKWTSKIACPEEPETVEVTDGKFKDPVTGLAIDLSPLYSKSYNTADLRGESSGVTKYGYLLGLNGNMDLSKLPKRDSKCNSSTAVCQYTSYGFERVVGDATMASYVSSDELLEVTFDSMDKCGKDPNKHSHSVVSLRCSRFGGIGAPQFVYESNECGYFFEWYTSAVCVNIAVDATDSSTLSGTNADGAAPNAAKQSHATVIAVFSISAILLACILTLILHKHERRAKLASRCRRCYWSCCRKMPNSRYRYLRVEDGEEETSLIDDGQDGSLLYGNDGKNPFEDASNFDNSEDIFAAPAVAIVGQKSRKLNSAGHSSAAAARSSSRSSGSRSNTVGQEGQDTDSSLLDFIDSSKSSANRTKNQTGSAQDEPAKFQSYHDDDDEDLLEG